MPARRKMDKEELNKYREKLLALKKEITKGLKNISKDAVNTAQEELSRSSSGYGMHIADDAADNFDREMSLNLASNESKILADIESALRRIDTKEFGICQMCNKPIPKNRLDAMPYVKLCKKCQEKSENSAGF